MSNTQSDASSKPSVPVQTAQQARHAQQVQQAQHAQQAQQVHAGNSSSTQYQDQLATFSLDSIPDLDIAVLGALELFSQQSIPELQTLAFTRPLVVGSGNAEATGKIIFQNSDALFASESDFEAKLQSVSAIDGVVLISASGGKHAPGIVQVAQKYHKKVLLLTNTPNCPASTFLNHSSGDSVCVFPKNREPYTYNTSTYMAMILGHTKENPAEIMAFIQNNIDQLNLPDLSTFSEFYFIIPPQFTGIIRMLHVKCMELFGRKIARDIETAEYVRHATTVVPGDELFISFGAHNTQWGKLSNRVTIPLPENAGYAAMMAIGYYTVAQIQKAHQPYFKENIVEYCKYVSSVFGSEITPIVE